MHAWKPLENICKTYFSNKAVKLVNLPLTLRNTCLVSLLKDLSYNFVTSTVVYNLKQPINLSTFNFKKFVFNVNID